MYYIELHSVCHYQVKENEMDRSCRVYGGEMRNVYNILIGKPKGRVYLDELGVDGRHS